MRFTADEKYVKVSGRTLVIGNVRYIDYSCSGIAFEFTGKTVRAVLTSDFKPDTEEIFLPFCAVLINGDTIQGDSVYNCRFEVNTDIDTNPDVSEDVYYHYYAEFVDEKGIHRSEPFQIWVLEQFTDKELDDMQIVDDAIAEMLNSNDFQKLTLEEKAKFAENRLHELEEQGYIQKGSIQVSDSNISFSYSSGGGGAMMLKPFDPMYN